MDSNMKHRTILLLTTAVAIFPISVLAQSTSSTSSGAQLTLPVTLAIVSTIVGVLALFRPELMQLVRRARNRIELFPLPRIEVGFSNFGPTIGIGGTIRSIPSDQFIRGMSIKLVRKRDSLTHTFDWAVFRSVGVLPSDVKDIRVAMGFKIAGGDAMPINIQFFDNDSRSRIEEQLLRLHNAWLEYLNSKHIVASSLDPQSMQSTFADFRSGKEGPVPEQVHSAIDRILYWDEGDYRATIDIMTWDPDKTFSFSGEFSLSKPETESMKLNTVPCILIACNQPDVRFNFVNPTFKL